MQLRDLQQAFKSEVLQGQSSAVQTLISACDFRPEQRVSVYRNNIESTLTEALENIYPVTCTMVGKEYFHHMARSYIHSYPPKSGDLRNYGARLPVFLQSIPELNDFAYLPDLAKIDWACHISFHASSTQALTVDCLSEYDANDYENIQFKVHPAVSAIRSDYPIFDIWDFATAKDPDATAPDLSVGEQQVLVYRKARTVKVAQIDRGFFKLIELITEQHTLATAFPTVLTLNSEYNLHEGLNRLFAYGAVCSITINR